MRAIAQFPVPFNTTELQRFMGMINQLAKFILGLADLNAPLPQLLHKETMWYWGDPQQMAFQRIKEILTSPKVHACYDTSRQTLSQQMAHKADLERFSFRSKTTDSAILSATSQGPSLMLKQSMWLSSKKHLPQSGHVNALKNFCWDSVSLQKKITSNLYPS